MENNKKFKAMRSLYIFIMGLYEFADKLFGSTYIVFMRQSGLSIKEISKLFSIEQLLIAVFDYPTGIISDKYGRKKILGIGLISWGISLVVFAYSSNFNMFLISMVLMALGISLISGSPDAWLIDHMIKYEVYDQREKILPVIRFSILTFALAASIVSYFTVGIKNYIPIVIGGVVILITGIITLIKGEDNYGDIKDRNLFNELFSNSKDFFKNKFLVLLALKNVIFYIAFIVFIINWQLFATENIGLKSSSLSILLFTFMIALMSGNYIVIKLVKYINKFKVSILGLTICLIGFGTIFFSESIMLFVLGAILVEFGMGVEQAATQTWMCDYIPSKTRATYSSIFSTIQTISGFFITNLVGIFTEKLGFRFGWGIAGVSIFLTISILVLFKNISANENEDKTIELLN